MRWPSIIALTVLLTLNGCFFTKRQGDILYEQTQPAHPHAWLESSLPETPEAYLRLADQSGGDLRVHYQLLAAQSAMQRNQLGLATALLQDIPTRDLPPDFIVRHQLLRSQLALLKNHSANAESALNQQERGVHLPSTNAQSAHQWQLASAQERQHHYLSAFKTRWALSNTLTSQHAIRENQKLFWSDLLKLSPKDYLSLSETTADAGDNTLEGWLSLAQIAKTPPSHERQQSLARWREDYPDHPAQQWFPQWFHWPKQASATTHEVALLLPLTGPLGRAGTAIRDGFSDAKQHSESTPSTLLIFDTHKLGASKALQLAKNAQASLIIGPLEKSSVATIADQASIETPILALNETRLPKNVPYLYEFGLFPSDELEQIAKRIWEDNHSKVFVIAPDTSWGHEQSTLFSRQFKHIGGVTPLHWFYDKHSPLDKQLQGVLSIDKAKTRAKALSANLHQPVGVAIAHHYDADAILLLAPPERARQIRPLLQYYDLSRLPTYSTAIIYGGRANPHLDHDLDGIVFCDLPFILHPTHHHTPPPNSSPKRLYALGLDAYTLSKSLSRLTNIQAFSIEGASGTLTIDHNGHVHRTLPFAKMVKGYAVSE